MSSTRRAVIASIEPAAGESGGKILMYQTGRDDDDTVLGLPRPVLIAPPTGGARG